VPHLVANWREAGFASTVCASPVAGGWGVGATGLWVMLFVYSKFAELGDTMFMIASNKEVPFIHWFHHAATLYFSWHSYRHESGYALYFITMNYSVHAVMYAYFAARSLNLVPASFPASAITVVQIAQMFVGVAVQLVAGGLYARGSCDSVRRGSLVLGTLMYGTYFYLFAEFLVRRLTARRAARRREPAVCCSGDADDPILCSHLVAQGDVATATAVGSALVAVLVALVTRRLAIDGGTVSKALAAAGLAWLVCAAARQAYNRAVRYAHWPSPAGTLPVLGNALGAAPAFMRYLLREAKRHPSGNFLFWPGGPTPIAVAANPKAAKEVLGMHTTFPKGPDYTKTFGVVFGKGLVTSMGPDHSRARRVLGKFFVKAHVEKHVLQMRDVTDALADEILEPRFAALDDAPVVDVQEFFHMVTLHIFCKTQLNIDAALLGTTRCSHRTDRACGFVGPGPLPPGAVARWIANEVTAGSNVVGTHIIYNIPMSSVFPGVRRTLASKARVHETLQAIVDARRDIMTTTADPPDDCLTALLREQQTNTEMPLPDTEIRQQIVTLISAGHDTTAYFCCYAALMLAKHPDIQDRLRAELADDANFDWPTSLLKRVVQEVLRLYPVIPMVTRVANKDAVLPSAAGGQPLAVPKGTKLVVPFFVLNRLPQYWGSDAAAFNPDRWLDTNNETLSDGIQFYKNGFMPFGYGSRTCIGYTFALVETRAILAKLLARYDLLELPGFIPTIKAGISLTVENPKGIKVRFKRRKL